MRLFVAVEFPQAVRRRAWRATAPLREADLPVKWVGPERLHLTLKFLGETDEARVPALGEALDRAAGAAGPLELRLAGVGAFPSLQAPRVLWIGVEGPPELERLHEAVDEALAELGFERERRDFHPHVTLGRARRGHGGLGRAERLVERIEVDVACTADDVRLVRSVLSPEGARYSVVSSHALSGGTRHDRKEGVRAQDDGGDEG